MAGYYLTALDYLGKVIAVNCNVRISQSNYYLWSGW